MTQETLTPTPTENNTTETGVKEPFFTRRLVASLGILGIGVAIAGMWYRGESTANDLRYQRDIAELERDANAEEANTALWLAQHGITQVVPDGINAWDYSPPVVTLSADQSAPKPCKVAFEFTGSALELNQKDAAGNVYDDPTIHNGEEAQVVLADICPVKP